jgi:hypothetical protein
MRLEKKRPIFLLDPFTSKANFTPHETHKTNIFIPYKRALHINDEFIGIQSSKIITLLIW